jgi:hypothetical protein
MAAPVVEVLRKVTPVVSSKKIHTCTYFIYVFTRPLGGGSLLTVTFGPPRINHYYEIPPDVLPPLLQPSCRMK